jgi:cell fate (sporulation/competence/biofilm development) regulator YlbF (YheA/YmcA/DUF963 family)
MQTIEDQKLPGTASLTDVAAKLGVAVVATAEYQALNAAEKRYQIDTQARELFGRFQEQQRTVQLMQQLGKATPEEMQHMEELQKNIETNETLTGYFDAQEKLVALLRELNEFISSKLNMDFAELTKPQRGCCG